MLIDLAEMAGGHVRSPEICIVGAGAAGLTAARRLLAKGHSVTVLESGGRDFEAPLADPNAGATRGEPYYYVQPARGAVLRAPTAALSKRPAPPSMRARRWGSLIIRSTMPGCDSSEARRRSGAAAAPS